MNTKAFQLMQEFYDVISIEYKDFYQELVSFLDEKQFFPSRNKTQDLTIDFKNSKLKKTIAKIEAYEQKHDSFGYKERSVPGLRLKFYASTNYSEIFQKGIKRVIEAFDGKYTGCYGCGRCTGKKQGYIYTYPDGKKVFRCGSELISIFDFSMSNIEEIKKLLVAQIDFWTNEVK